MVVTFHNYPAFISRSVCYGKQLISRFICRSHSEHRRSYSKRIPSYAIGSNTPLVQYIARRARFSALGLFETLPECPVEVINTSWQRNIFQHIYCYIFAHPLTFWSSRSSFSLNTLVVFMASAFSRGWISKSFLLQYWHSGDVWQPQRDVANLHGKWVKCTKSVGRTTWQPSTQTLITFLTCVFSYLCIIMTYIAWWNAWRVRLASTIRKCPDLTETISIYIYPYGGAFGSMPPLGRSATAASQLVHTQQFKLCIRQRCSITYHTQTKQLQPFQDLDSNNEQCKLQLRTPPNSQQGRHKPCHIETAWFVAWVGMLCTCVHLSVCVCAQKRVSVCGVFRFTWLQRRGRR